MNAGGSGINGQMLYETHTRWEFLVRDPVVASYPSFRAFGSRIHPQSGKLWKSSTVLFPADFVKVHEHLYQGHQDLE